MRKCFPSLAHFWKCLLIVNCFLFSSALLQAETIEEKWEHRTGRMVSFIASYGENICFTSKDGTIYCVNSNGEVLWEKSLGCELRGVATSLNEKRVYVGGGDGKIYCLKVIDYKPTIEWALSLAQGSSSIDVRGVDVHEKTGEIFCSTDEGVFCIAATKQQEVFNPKIRWAKNFSNFGRAVRVDSARNLVYVGCGDKNLYCFETTQGKELLERRFKAKGQIRGLAIDSKSGRLFFGSDDGHFYSYHPEKQTLLQDLDLEVEVLGVTIEPKSNFFYLGTKSGKVLKFSPRRDDSGAINGIRSEEVVFSTGGMVTTILVHNNHLYAGTALHSLHCFLTPKTHASSYSAVSPYTIFTFDSEGNIIDPESGHPIENQVAIQKMCEEFCRLKIELNDFKNLTLFQEREITIDKVIEENRFISSIVNNAYYRNSFTERLLPLSTNFDTLLMLEDEKLYFIVGKKSCGEMVFEKKQICCAKTVPALGSNNYIYFGVQNGIQKSKIENGEKVEGAQILSFGPYADISSVVIADAKGKDSDTVYFISENQIYGISANDKSIYEGVTDCILNVPPTVEEGGALYFPSKSGVIYILKNKELTKITVHSTIDSPLAIIGDYIYFISEDHLICMNKNGQEKWARYFYSPTVPVVGPGKPGKKAIYIGDGHGTIHCIDEGQREDTWFIVKKSPVVGAFNLKNMINFVLEDGSVYRISSCK